MAPPSRATFRESVINMFRLIRQGKKANRKQHTNSLWTRVFQKTLWLGFFAHRVLCHGNVATLTNHPCLMMPSHKGVLTPDPHVL
jgi:hypothetical protein